MESVRPEIWIQVPKSTAFYAVSGVHVAVLENQYWFINLALVRTHFRSRSPRLTASGP